MIELFHVAPQGHLAVGQSLAARRPESLPDLQQEVLDSLLPGGRVTPWGEAMLADPDVRLHVGDRGLIDFGLAVVPGAETGDRTMHVNPEGRTAMNQTVSRVLDLIYELMRQVGFADRPSRLTCVFAYRSLEAAEQYRALRRDPATHQIWTVRAPKDTPTHDADATWLTMAQNGLAVLLGAREYWRGQEHPDCCTLMDRETLVPADAVTVVERVAHVEERTP